MYKTEKLGSTQMEIEGPSLEWIKNRLQREYGDMYQILNYKTTLKGGLFGFFQKEIVNANYVVEDSFNRYNSVPDPLKKMPYSGGADYSPYQRPQSYPQKTDYMPYVQREVPVKTGMADPNQNSFTAKRDEFLKQTLGNGNVTSMLQVAQLTKQIEKLGEKIDSVSQAQAASQGDENATIQKINDLLVQNEFTQNYIRKMDDKIRREFNLEDLEDFDRVQDSVIDWIGETISIAPKFNSKGKIAHVIVVVGPTGVGKTTTIARMAAKLRKVAQSKKLPAPAIKMITMDTWRVGAFEQLKHYGDAIEIDVDKAESADDLKSLFDSYKNSMDFVLIDTSGYSPNDYENIAKMRSMLDVKGMQPDIYLAVAASTKASDLEKIIRNYESFDFRSVIVTKCDETSAYGNVISILSEKNKQISMITDGQQVLHSLKRASPVLFLRQLIGFQVNKDKVVKKFGSENEEE
ncbi:MAG: hypothetical protein II507_04575 [Treponema sp.]|jgi:flagellar biosynthesis protein FlhF|nr:hypothetical protein [Treponema sp.]